MRNTALWLSNKTLRLLHLIPIAHTENPMPKIAPATLSSRIYVKHVYQIMLDNPVLGHIPAGPRLSYPGAPLPVEQFTFDCPLEAHDAAILLESYLSRHAAHANP